MILTIDVLMMITFILSENQVFEHCSDILAF